MLLDFKASNAKSLLVALIFNNTTLSPRRILQLYGMKLALEHMSIRKLRTIFGACNKRNWYRLITDMKDVIITQQPTPRNPFRVIRDCLEACKANENHATLELFLLTFLLKSKIYFLVLNVIINK